MPGQSYGKQESKAPLVGPSAWAQRETWHQEGKIATTTHLCEKHGELQYTYDAVEAAARHMATLPPQTKHASFFLQGTARIACSVLFFMMLVTGGIYLSGPLLNDILQFIFSF